MLSSNSWTSTTWYGSAIHLRVLLGGRDEGRDAGGRVLDLVHQQFGLDGVVQPPHGALERGRVDGADELLQPVDVEPGLHERRREVPAAADAVRVQPVGHGVLTVGCRDRAQIRGLRDVLDGVLLQSDQRLERGPVVGAGRDERQLVPHAGDPFPQGRRGAHRGGRWIVQLVGEPGREGTQCEQSFALTYGLLAGPDAVEHPFQHVHCHREPLVHHLREHLRIEHEHARCLGHAHRVVVDRRGPIAEEGVPRSGVGAPLRGSVGLDVIGTDLARQRDLAVEHHVEAGGGLSLAIHVAGFDVLDAALAAQPVQLLVVEFLEQEQRAKFVDAAGQALGHSFSKYRWTSMTAIAPSPTADATRLADSARASPATNTPGMLVSR